MYIGTKGTHGGYHRRCALSPRTLIEVLSTFTGLIVSITRLFSLCPNPLCSLIITTARVEKQIPTRYNLLFALSLPLIIIPLFFVQVIIPLLFVAIPFVIFPTPHSLAPPRFRQWIVWVFRPSTRNVKHALFLLHLPYKLVATIIPLNNPWKPVFVFPGAEESKTRQRRALSTGPFTVFHPRREILSRLQSIKNTTGVETVVLYDFPPGRMVDFTRGSEE